MNKIIFSVEKSYRRIVDNLIILLVLKFDSHKPNRLGVVLFTSPAPESRRHPDNPARPAHGAARQGHPHG